LVAETFHFLGPAQCFLEPSLKQLKWI
jgi:hypothetical protein